MTKGDLMDNLARPGDAHTFAKQFATMLDSPAA